MALGLLTFFPFLSIDNVLYIIRSLFNFLSISHLTCSLASVNSFMQNIVCLPYRSSRHVIDTGCESYGLYHLHLSSHVGIIMEAPSPFHAQLGYPCLAKLQQLVSTLSMLSNLV